MDNKKQESKKKKRKIKRMIISVLLLISFMVAFTVKTPVGTSVRSGYKNGSKAEFIYDLTYRKGGMVVEQNIFESQLRLIENAKDFIIADLFLFNDLYNSEFSDGSKYPEISGRLKDALVEKKRNFPQMDIIFITDEINTFYGSYESKEIEALKAAGIEVVITDLDKMRDSNPLYSGPWRMFFSFLPTNGEGLLPNPFSKEAPSPSLTAYMKLLNFKANHRKVMVSESEAVVSSSNPHDASGFHSNIAFHLQGEILDEIVESELAVAKFSGLELESQDFATIGKAGLDSSDEIMLITEGKIRSELVSTMDALEEGDRLSIGMFYLSDRKIVKAIKEAYDRGVDIRLVLDANKDAFGLEKSGIPNRPVAYELYSHSKGNIDIRWYKTNGEQYHAKLLMMERGDDVYIAGGSANLTRRNIGDFNLESDVMIRTKKGSQLHLDVSSYFGRIWNNEGGEYTVDYDEYSDESKIKKAIYIFQEITGLGTF